MADLLGFQVRFGRTAEVLVGVLSVVTFITLYGASELDSVFLLLLSMVEGGLLFFIIGFASVRLARLVEDIPTSKIRSIAMGLVEIKGSISKPIKEYIIAPLSKKKCVSYRITAFYDSEDIEKSRVIKQFTELFFVKDNTGAVLVNPAGATVDVKPEATTTNWRKYTFLLKGVSLKQLRCLEETILVPDQEVYILGTAGDNPHKEEATAVKGVEDAMIQEAENPFYISDKSEKGFVSKYRYWGWFFVIAGSGLFVGGVFLLIAQVI